MPAYLDFEFDVPESGDMPADWLGSILANVRQRAGGRCHVTVTGPRRSILANRYYRGPAVMGPILAAYSRQGQLMSPDGLHEYNKALHLPGIADLLRADEGDAFQYVKEVALPDGLIRACYTTTLMDSTAFSYFIAAVKADERWRAMGVEFPDEPLPKGMRSFDLEEDPLWVDSTDLPDYPASAVIGHTPEEPAPALSAGSFYDLSPADQQAELERLF